MLNELWLHSQRRHCISFVGMIAGHERDVNHNKDRMQIGQVRSTWCISDHTSCLLCEHSLLSCLENSMHRHPKQPLLLLLHAHLRK